MNNILIVESKNDEFFVRALIEHMNISHIQVDEHPVCNVDRFECMGGLNPKELRKRLEALKNQLPKKDINAIGIILDHDGKYDERINLINESVHDVFQTHENIMKTGQFITAGAEVGGDHFNLRIGCYLVNVEQNGELETLLKAIKSKNSPYADCLEAWRHCVEEKLNAISYEEKQEVISDKEFVKFWVNNYIRFDTCFGKEKKQAAKKCSAGSLEYVFNNKKDIFDFDSPALEDFKNFLELFKI